MTVMVAMGRIAAVAQIDHAPIDHIRAQYGATWRIQLISVCGGSDAAYRYRYCI